VLPETIAAYLTAENAKDADAQSLLFTEDASVHDENADYRGREAIRAWKKTAQAKYQYETEVLDSSSSGDTTTVRTRLSGNFPGSTVELELTFTLSNGKIAALVID
jgi:hypothetical protein